MVIRVICLQWYLSWRKCTCVCYFHFRCYMLVPSYRRCSSSHSPHLSHPCLHLSHTDSISLKVHVGVEIQCFGTMVTEQTPFCLKVTPKLLNQLEPSAKKPLFFRRIPVLWLYLKESANSNQRNAFLSRWLASDWYKIIFYPIIKRSVCFWMARTGESDLWHLPGPLKGLYICCLDSRWSVTPTH